MMHGNAFSPHGHVEGSDARDRAVRVAGELAERGVGSVELRARGVSRVLAARVTDLPGELLGAVRGELIVPSLGVKVVFDESGASWERLDGEQV